MKFSEENLKALSDLIGVTIREILGLEPGQTLDDKLKYLPTKEEFYEETSKITKELKDMREEHRALNITVTRHTEQIKALQSL